MAPPFALSLAGVLVLGLAAFRATRLLVVDDFPPIKRFREALERRFGRDSFAIELIGCPWCASVWIGAGMVAVTALFPPVWFLWLALALSAVTGLVATWEDE